MIINIRGTSGSGKTYVVRKFMEHCGLVTHIYDENGKVIAELCHHDMIPVYFIGSYVNVCGGCDTISTQDMACSLVRHFSQFGHVIFEGLLMSHLYARYAALWTELTEFGIPFMFAYMDTPLEICVNRVKKRRLDRGDNRYFNPQNTISHYDATWKTKEKFDAADMTTTIIRYKKDPVHELSEILSYDVYTEFKDSYREDKFR